MIYSLQKGKIKKAHRLPKNCSLRVSGPGLVIMVIILWRQTIGQVCLSKNVVFRGGTRYRPKYTRYPVPPLYGTTTI